MFLTVGIPALNRSRLYIARGGKASDIKGSGEWQVASDDKDRGSGLGTGDSKLENRNSNLEIRKSKFGNRKTCPEPVRPSAANGTERNEGGSG